MRKDSKVWIVLDNPGQMGGIEAFTGDLVRALDGGFNIKLIYLHAHSINISKGSYAFKKSWPFFLKKIFMFIFINKVDYLIYHQPGHLKYYLRNTAKTIFFVHNPSEIKKFKNLEFLDKIKIVCVAEHIIDYLSSYPQKKIKIIPPIYKCDSAISKNKYGYKFLYLGRFSGEKKLERSVNFLKGIALENKNVEITLDLIGEGREKENLTSIINNLKIPNLIITIKPWVSRDRLCSLFLNYDFYISTSEIEGMPIAVREAMSAGLIPVVSDIPAHKEIITNLFNGFILDKNYNNSMLMSKTSDLHLRTQMIENARSTVTNDTFENFKYSIKQIFNN